jgi:hypothetical protein
VKAFIKACAVAAALALPLTAYAETAAPKTDAAPTTPAATMNCPMMGDMQKNMGAMMKDMSAMMGSTTDPSLKAQMQKMHEQMGAMMGNMQTMMGGGMMDGGMMGNGMMPGGQNSETAPSPAPSAFPDDKKAQP